MSVNNSEMMHVGKATRLKRRNNKVYRSNNKQTLNAYFWRCEALKIHRYHKSGNWN